MLDQIGIQICRSKIVASGEVATGAASAETRDEDCGTHVGTKFGPPRIEKGYWRGGYLMGAGFRLR